MQIAKNQHYVPQFILKNFSAGKKFNIWVFDKKKETIFKTNIRNIASEKGFYNFIFKGVKLTIEPSLANIEGAVASILKPIIKNENLSILKDENRNILSHFFALQFVRTKQHRLMWQDITKKFVNIICKDGGNPEDIQGYKKETEEDVKAQNIKSIYKSSDYAPHFFNKCWLLFKTTKNQPFYISDNPIALQNMTDHGPYGNIGLAVKGIEIYFPLTKTLSLGMYCPTIEEEMRKGYEQYKYLSKINPSLVAMTVKDPSGIESIMAGIETGRPISSKNENVINHNSLQVKYSSRFVFSSKNDFSLAKEMVRSHPDLKEGPKLQVG